MKRILFLAQSLNGYIAEKDDETPWSKEEFNEFRTQTSESGNLIIGKSTYEIMFEDNDLDGFEDIDIVVVGSSDVRNDSLNFVKAVKTPQEALAIVEQRGHQRAHVAGGAYLGTTMLDQDLIDEVWLDIEPQLLAEGVNLINPTVNPQLHLKLKLIETKQISDDVVQLRYQT